MNKKAIGEYRRLLETVPCNIIAAYEDKHMNGESLWDILDSYEQASRRISIGQSTIKYSILCCLLPLVVMIDAVKQSLSDMLHIEPVAVAAFVTIIVLFATMFIGNRIREKGYKMAEGPEDRLHSFVNTITTLTTSINCPDINQLTDRVIRGKLIALAAEIMRDEVEFQRIRHNNQYTYLTVVVAGQRLESLKSQFSKAWGIISGLDLYDPNTSEPYDKQIIFSAARSMMSSVSHI